EKFLLLILTGGAPVSAEHETGDPGSVKSRLEQFSKPHQPLGLRGLLAEDLAGALPHLAHKDARVRSDPVRHTRRRFHDEEERKRGQQQTTGHRSKPFPIMNAWRVRPNNRSRTLSEIGVRGTQE